MISRDDWLRMSWHARDRYMRKHRVRPVPTEVEEPKPVRKSVRQPSMMNEGLIHRCPECGGWMIDVCGTDHGRRYEP